MRSRTILRTTAWSSSRWLHGNLLAIALVLLVATFSAQAVAVAKVYVSDAIRQIGNLAVQTHGGIGFTWEHDLHLYYRRAKSDEYLLGDASFHREQMAELIFSGQ